MTAPVNLTSPPAQCANTELPVTGDPPANPFAQADCYEKLPEKIQQALALAKSSGVVNESYNPCTPLLAKNVMPDQLEDIFIGKEDSPHRLHYVKSRNWVEGRELVVLTPGVPENWYTFRDYVSFYTDEMKMNVAILDPRGYNGSGKPEQVFKYNMGLMQNDIGRVIKDVGYKTAHLVGHDVGAGMSVVYTMFHPHKVSSLVMLAVPHPASLTTALKSGDLPSYQGHINRMLDDQQAQEFFTTTDSIDLYKGADPIEVSLIYAALWMKGYEPAVNFYKANFGPGALKIPSWLFPKIRQAPTLIMLGDQDPFLYTDKYESPDKYVTHLEQVTLPGGGHFFPEDAPETVKQHLREFYKKQRK